MIDPNVPAEIVQQLMAFGCVEARRVPRGLSGADLFSCRLQSGRQLALKCWPEGTARSRVSEVHRVIRHCRSRGCEIVPQIETWPNEQLNSCDAIHTHGGRHWELLEWRRGHPAEADATLEVIRCGASAIAEFHIASGTLGKWSQPAAAFEARIQRLAQLESLIPQAIDSLASGEMAPEIAPVLHDACQCVRLRWDQVRDRIASTMANWATRPCLTQFVLRDVHRGNVLFENRRVSGLIDFDAVRIDTPATDLARWAMSFLASREETEVVWETAMAGFCDENALKSGHLIDFDPKMAKDICFATIWISLANWLVWILCEQRVFPTTAAAVGERVGELLNLAWRTD